MEAYERTRKRQHEATRRQKNPWRKWYQLDRWQLLRAAQLYREPLCRMCSEEGKTVPATIVDHVEPHRGDWDKFWHGDVDSLCEHHHNSTKQKEERNAHKPRIGLDGWRVTESR